MEDTSVAPQFRGWPKISRLNRECIVTEKIDGTNAAIIISNEYVPYGTGADEIVNGGIVIYPSDHTYPVWVGAQSRKNLISPEKDNFGFARWVRENAPALVDALGEGYHFGEWWGSGIQRGYGLEKGVKRFSLFNVKRFREFWPSNGQEDSLLYTVPVIDEIPSLSSPIVQSSVEDLRTHGSAASPGFMNPEGVVVFHSASQTCYKVMLDNDEGYKG
jgi:hypothetical protein